MGSTTNKQIAKKVPTPRPVVVEQVCDTCGEDWAEHPEDATVMDCLEILKQKKNTYYINHIDVCCGHGHHCCHSWHYHTWTYPQWTYTIGTTPLSGTTYASSNNIAVTPSLSNTLSLNA